MTNDRVRDRIRKLLRLADSDSHHEAAQAKRRAQVLLWKHGLTRDDVEEAIEITNVRSGVLFEDLARAVATFRGVTARVAVLSGAVAFSGVRTQVKTARVLYERLVREAQTKAVLRDAPPEGQEAWRACFFLGFAASVSERLLENAPKRVKENADEKSKKAARKRDRDAAEEALRALQALRDALRDVVPNPEGVVDTIQRRAHDRGRTLGFVIDLKDPPVPPRGLLYPADPVEVARDVFRKTELARFALDFGDASASSVETQEDARVVDVIESTFRR